MRPLQPITLVDVLLGWIAEHRQDETGGDYAAGWTDALIETKEVILMWAKNVGQETNDKTS